MENISPYSKLYTDLTDDEKKVWELSYEVLVRGDRLYGTSQSDTSHLGWAIGVFLDTLRDAFKQNPEMFVSLFIELGIGADGYSIRHVKAEESTTQASNKNNAESA